MSTPLRRVVQVLCVLAFPVGAQAFTRTSFEIPQGWSELSVGAPGPRDPRFSAAAVARMTDGRFLMSAFDLDHADDGYAENMLVMIRPLPHGTLTPIDTLWLHAAVAAMGPAMHNRSSVEAFQNVSQQVQVLHGVHVGRLENRATVDGVTVRQVMYFLPGPDQVAVLTYSAAPGQFDKYVALFDGSARATRDLVEPRSRWARMSWIAGFMVGFWLTMALLVLVVVLVLRKRPGTPQVPSPYG